MRRRRLAPLVAIVVLAFGSLAATRLAGYSPQLGLDLQGGASVVLEPEGRVASGQLAQTISIIRNRVDALGVAEPDITRQGDAIVVQLPGVEDQQRALDIVGQTAELRFRPVLAVLPPPGAPPTTAPPATAPQGTTTTAPAPEGGDSQEQGLGLRGLHPGDAPARAAGAAPGESAQATTTAPPTTAPPTTAPPTTAPPTTQPGAPPADGQGITPREQDDPEQQVVLPERDNGDIVARYQLGPAALTGEALSTARAQFTNGRWSVGVEFKRDGIDQFNEVAATCFNGAPTCPTRQLAIVLDGVVESAPVIQQPSFQRDQIEISGDFTESEAKNLALVLRYGSLPVELEPQTVQTVSATLGRDSLQAGLVAGLGGVALVALYMILYYRALGLVVIAGLAVWASLMLAIVSYLGETAGLALTLAGATGIIVSIGVTVDSYVVFFERLKDEVRSGRSLRASTERGFSRAFRTIVTADVSSFMGAALLYWLTVGPVRGFAFYLGLSTILDVIVAYFFTRPTVALLGRSRLFTHAPWLGVARGLPQPATAEAAAGGRA